MCFPSFFIVSCLCGCLRNSYLFLVIGFIAHYSYKVEQSYAGTFIRPVEGSSGGDAGGVGENDGNSGHGLSSKSDSSNSSDEEWNDNVPKHITVSLESNSYKVVIFRRQTVWSLKKTLKKLITGLHRRDMKLYFAGLLMDDNRRLTSYNIKECSNLLLMMAGIGGAGQKRKITVADMKALPSDPEVLQAIFNESSFNATGWLSTLSKVLRSVLKGFV